MILYRESLYKGLPLKCKNFKVDENSHFILRYNGEVEYDSIVIENLGKNLMLDISELGKNASVEIKNLTLQRGDSFEDDEELDINLDKNVKVNLMLVDDSEGVGKPYFKINDCIINYEQNPMQSLIAFATKKGFELKNVINMQTAETASIVAHDFKLTIDEEERAFVTTNVSNNFRVDGSFIAENIKARIDVERATIKGDVSISSKADVFTMRRATLTCKNAEISEKFNLDTVKSAEFKSSGNDKLILNHIGINRCKEVEFIADANVKSLAVSKSNIKGCNITDSTELIVTNSEIRDCSFAEGVYYLNYVSAEDSSLKNRSDEYSFDIQGIGGQLRFKNCEIDSGTCDDKVNINAYMKEGDNTEITNSRIESECAFSGVYRIKDSNIEKSTITRCEELNSCDIAQTKIVCASEEDKIFLLKNLCELATTRVFAPNEIYDGSEENAARRGFKSQNDSVQVKEIDKNVDIEL